MSKKWFLWRGLAGVILISLLIGGGVAIHYVGWSRGYAMGQLAAEGEESATAPYWFGYRRPLGFAPLMFGVGLILKIGLLLLLFGAIARLFRFAVWGIAGGPMWGGPRARYLRRVHRRWAHGPVPPWCWDLQDWPEKAEKAKPDAQTSEDQ